MTSQNRILHPRFPLFTKILAGFGFIVLFMVLASLTILLQLLPEDQSEFRVLPLIQYLDKVFNTEVEATRKYFVTRAEVDAQKLALTSGQFRRATDSLSHLSSQNSIKTILDDAIVLHERYEDFLARTRTRLEQDRDFDALGSLHVHTALIDSIQKQIGVLSNAYLPILNGALKKYNQKMSDALLTGRIILILALAIGSVFAFLLARTFTKPIQALQAGTKKVGEGHYETVPITTNDEIADLTLAFNLMSDKLKQLDEMRMQMMSEISHEMRTPLQVIKAGCYSIVHTKDGPQLTQRQRDAVGMIHQATNRINDFVNLFLDIAKMEAGLMKFSFNKMDLVEVLNPLIHEAQLIGQARQVKVEFTFDQLPMMMIDKDRMSQAVSNLLSNALKYTPDNGSVTVRITKLAECDEQIMRGKECVRIEVQDSGVGIPESDLARLFTKFYQAKNTPLVKEKGSGLGLALVKHVAEAHGGKVGVQSQVGVGSTFMIVLPINL